MLVQFLLVVLVLLRSTSFVISIGFGYVLLSEISSRFGFGKGLAVEEQECRGNKNSFIEG